MLLAAIMCLSASGCYSPPKYTDAELVRLREGKRAVELTYCTRAGRQVAYYVFPPSNPDRPPSLLVIAYPGIGSRALDWMRILDHAPKTGAGFLLIDYPGFGVNEGMIRPKYLCESTEGAIHALEGHFNKRRCGEISLLAHSFGCAAALQFSARFPVSKVVLVAPFTTLRDIVYMKTGPIAWLIPDKMDNEEYLKELYNRTPRPEVTIIHGDEDRVVPVTMGRELFSLFPSWIHYREIPGAGHSDVIQKTEDLLFQALLF